MTLLTDYELISGFPKLTQFLLAYMRVRYGLLLSYDKVEKWITPFTIGDSAKKGSRSQRHHSFMVRCARVQPGAPAIQLVLHCNAPV